MDFTGDILHSSSSVFGTNKMIIIEKNFRNSKSILSKLIGRLAILIFVVITRRRFPPGTKGEEGSASMHLQLCRADKQRV